MDPQHKARLGALKALIDELDNSEADSLRPKPPEPQMDEAAPDGADDSAPGDEMSPEDAEMLKAKLAELLK